MRVRPSSRRLGEAYAEAARREPRASASRPSPALGSACPRRTLRFTCLLDVGVSGDSHSARSANQIRIHRAVLGEERRGTPVRTSGHGLLVKNRTGSSPASPFLSLAPESLACQLQDG